MAGTRPRLIAITDVAVHGPARTLELFEHLCHAARPGSVCVQLRWDAAPRELFALGERLCAICVDSEQILSINERLDVALALGATAVHLKTRSVAAREVRALWGSRGRDVWVTRAWHPADESVPLDVDALVASPVAAERKGQPPLGTDGLRAACLGCPVPVYALGGVDSSNAASMILAGAQGVAAIGACHDEPLALLEALGARRGN